MSEADDERAAWSAQSALADQAFAFWCGFLNLRDGDAQPLDADARANWRTIIRAISWTESRHGTIVGGVHGDTDPMQCANPRDTWWRELTGQTASQDRFVGGPSAGNWNAKDLPNAIKTAAGGLPLDGLGDVTRGHDDDAFTPALSYFWAVPFVIHRSNRPADGASYKCGDSSLEQLIQGAVRYNGGGDASYEAKVRLAVAIITGS